MSTVLYTVLDGEVIAEDRNGVRKEYLPDPLGSTVALLDSNLNQTDTFSYWPYGEVNVRTGNTPTPFQFVGTLGYYQDSSSKTYVRARHLDTQKGRWLTPDPIEFNGIGLNLYCYVQNCPLVWIDPLGLQTDTCQKKGHGKGGSKPGGDGKPKNPCDPFPGYHHQGPGTGLHPCQNKDTQAACDYACQDNKVGTNGHKYTLCCCSNPVSKPGNHVFIWAICTDGSVHGTVVKGNGPSRPIGLL